MLDGRGRERGLLDGRERGNHLMEERETRLMVEGGNHLMEERIRLRIDRITDV